MPNVSLLYFYSFQGEDEGLKEFLAKDREAEFRHFKTSQAETRKLIRDALLVDWGRGEVVSPNQTKDLILQVTTSICDTAQVWGGPRATEHTKECLLPRRPGC